VGAVIGGLVQHGATGLAFRAGKAHDLARTIQQMLDEHELRERLGRLAGVKVADYDYPAAADAFAEALGSVGAI